MRWLRRRRSVPVSLRIAVTVQSAPLELWLQQEVDWWNWCASAPDLSRQQREQREQVARFYGDLLCRVRDTS